jgi:hypothetical protein
MNADGSGETIGKTIMFWFDKITQSSTMPELLGKARAYFKPDKNHFHDVNIPNVKVDYV